MQLRCTLSSIALPDETAANFNVCLLFQSNVLCSAYWRRINVGIGGNE